MDKRTEDSKLEELEQALDMFCAHEYGRSNDFELSNKNFKLFAVDSGGYDITSDVTLEIKDGKIKLLVATKFDDTNFPWRSSEIKEFDLTLAE